MLGRFRSWMRRRAWSDKVSAEGAGVVPAAATTPPANGAIPNRPSNLRRDRLLMAHNLLCQLWHQYAVFLTCRHYVPQRHHGVVFMHHVMAVDGVLAQPVAETEEQLHPLVGMQRSHVFAAEILGHSWRNPVAVHDLVLFQVDVDRVRPIAGEVGQ